MAHSIWAMLLTLVLFLTVIPTLYWYDGVRDDAAEESTAAPFGSDASAPGGDGDAGAPNETAANTTTGNATASSSAP